MDVKADSVGSRTILEPPLCAYRVSPATLRTAASILCLVDCLHLYLVATSAHVARFGASVSIAFMMFLTGIVVLRAIRNPDLIAVYPDFVRFRHPLSVWKSCVIPRANICKAFCVWNGSHCPEDMPSLIFETNEAIPSSAGILYTIPHSVRLKYDLTLTGTLYSFPCYDLNATRAICQALHKNQPT